MVDCKLVIECETGDEHYVALDEAEREQRERDARDYSGVAEAELEALREVRLLRQKLASGKATDVEIQRALALLLA